MLLAAYHSLITTHYLPFDPYYSLLTTHVLQEQGILPLAISCITVPFATGHFSLEELGFVRKDKDKDEEPYYPPLSTRCYLLLTTCYTILNNTHYSLPTSYCPLSNAYCL